VKKIVFLNDSAREVRILKGLSGAESKERGVVFTTPLLFLAPFFTRKRDEKARFLKKVKTFFQLIHFFGSSLLSHIFTYNGL